MYKGKGTTFDKLVRWFTNSIYSHVEIYDVNSNQSYSSSFRDGGVRKKTIVFNSESWDFFFIDQKYTSEMLEDFFISTKGSKYDMLGVVIGHLIKMPLHYKKKYFCNEWCGEFLQVSQPHKFNPKTLLEHLVEVDKVTTYKEHA